jgi:hypothetical protein
VGRAAEFESPAHVLPSPRNGRSRPSPIQCRRRCAFVSSH